MSGGVRFSEEWLREHQARQGAIAQARPVVTAAIVLPDDADEETHQLALMRWAENVVEVHPELALLTHVPNGGKRRKSEAARLKGMGVRPGYPDLALNVPRGPYAGLFIELKASNGKVSAEQSDWIKVLNRWGNRAVVCWGADAARLEILNYLALGVT